VKFLKNIVPKNPPGALRILSPAPKAMMIGGGLIFIIYGISLGERGNFYTETINIRNYQPVESILLPYNGSLYMRVS
jgi:hypothetical protein